MMSRKMQLLMDRRTQTLTLSLANAGVHAASYARVMVRDDTMREVYRLFLSRPPDAVDASECIPVPEALRDRQLEDRFLSRLFELGLRDAEPIGNVLRDENWFRALAAKMR